jgi:hypothetical protein
MNSVQLRRAARTQWRRVDDAYRSVTATMRVLPDFLIVGEAKCGTTSLYDDIVQHPLVLEAAMKEVHFFDLRFHRGLDWYRAQFPLEWRIRSSQAGRPRFQTGEASPYYMYHPHAPARIKQTLPNVQLIAMLRNPVERAYSQYQHEFRKGRESLQSFAEAVAQEPKRLRGEVERMLENPRYNSVEHRRHSYLARGIYVDYLQTLQRIFGHERLLVLKSEDYFAAPEQTLARVFQFLGLPVLKRKTFARRNTGRYSPIDSGLRETLVQYYSPHNARLYELLGVDFGWC